MNAGRRFRDRLLVRSGGDHPSLRARSELASTLVIVDDDLKQSAEQLSAIESYLGRAVEVLERGEVGALPSGEEIAGRVDALADALASLQRRLGDLAARLG